MRFDRRAMEVRVLDLQECPKMDVAIAAFVRGALASMSARIAAGELALPDRRSLLADYRGAVTKGLDAPVSTHLLAGKRRARTARGVLSGLLDDAAEYVSATEQPYLRLVAERIVQGNLAERILRRVGRAERRRRRDAIVDVYGELMHCLEANTPWPG